MAGGVDAVEGFGPVEGYEEDVGGGEGEEGKGCCLGGRGGEFHWGGGGGGGHWPIGCQGKVMSRWDCGSGRELWIEEEREDWAMTELRFGFWC